MSSLDDWGVYIERDWHPNVIAASLLTECEAQEGRKELVDYTERTWRSAGLTWTQVNKEQKFFYLILNSLEKKLQIQLSCMIANTVFYTVLRGGDMSQHMKNMNP
jgi:hypothetical protein